jgi:quercetin dioxygenase-like cupin family protein
LKDRATLIRPLRGELDLAAALDRSQKIFTAIISLPVFLLTDRVPEWKRDISTRGGEMTRILAAILFLIGAALAVQAPVPVNQEPHHHFKFENEYVRVYDVAVPAHDETLFHVHSNDYVYVNLLDVDVKAQALDGPINSLAAKTGQCVFSKAPITHRVLNPSDQPFRNITVEILKTPPAPPGDSSSVSGVPGYSPVLDNDRVRVTRLILEPGQSTGLHKQNLMNLAIAVSGAKLAFMEPGQSEQVVELKKGDFNWHAEPRTHSLKNVGDTRFEAIVIEWK